MEQHSAPPRLRLERGPSFGRIRRPAVLLGAGIVLVLFVAPALLQLGVDWMWYTTIGYQVVLQRDVIARLALFFGVGAVVYALLAVNLRVANRPSGEPVQYRAVPDGLVEVIDRVPRFATPVALVFAGLVGLAASASWMSVLQFLRAVPFGISDPVFGHDVGYYVFTLPVISFALGILSTLIVVSALMAGFLYLLRGEIGAPGPQFQVSHRASTHLAVLLIAFLVLSAVHVWLVDLPQLLFSDSGLFVGAGYADLHAARPGMHIAAVAALLAAATVVVGITRRRVAAYAAVAVVAYATVSVLARVVYPAAVQRLVVAPTELTRETPYLQNHIAATRRAWDIDSVQTRDLTGDATLSLADIRANTPTIENVRLWDREPLLQTFGQLQEIRTYYDFVSVDDDRYWIDGRYRQVLLSPRELNTEALPTRSFINDQLTYTHGMGLTMAPVNQVTPEGLPVLFIKDLPPVSSVSLTISRPQIYYGELTNTNAIVDTKQREFDHPSGETNIFASYEGGGGVTVGGFLRRSLLAWNFSSLKILLSQDIGAGSRILFHRNVVDRARRALPFVRLDADPYLVIADSGRLVWLIDAYTTSTQYPYSQHLSDGTSYMRNSVKVSIDAYDGTVRAYISDASDPIVRTMAQVFPGILLPMDSMPPVLRAHVRYPEDLYRAQASLYTTYHMTEADQFYHREDQWQIPVVDQGQSHNPFMRHIVMRLPDEAREEYIFMAPFTPRQKDNLAAWMVARNDSEHYGQLVVYRLPKQSLVLRAAADREPDQPGHPDLAAAEPVGPARVGGDPRRAACDPDREIAALRGAAVPARRGGQIPELKRVVIAHQNRVVMAETLEAGLEQLFGGSSGAESASAVPGETAPATAGQAAPTTSLQELLDHYQRATEAQRAGDWAKYGEEMKALGELLQRMTGGTRKP